MTSLGFDIGGANLKAAHSSGLARSMSFPLWKQPDELSSALAGLCGDLPPADLVAVTMSGELCDCFEDQAEGVRFILDAARRFAADRRFLAWTLDGFVCGERASAAPERVAAANWLAQGHWVSRQIGSDSVLLVDMGSTTTDLVPIVRGRPAPKAWTDPERLDAGELVYTGAARTSVCAVLGGRSVPPVAAEFFATMRDVYLVLGWGEPDPEDRDTADGRPATVLPARARLARMRCADPARFSVEEAESLARQAAEVQAGGIRSALEEVRTRMSEAPSGLVLSGSGEAILNRLLGDFPLPSARVSEWVGSEISKVACAWAVARLALEAVDG